MQKIKIKFHNFILHPSGAIYWEEQKMLLIADVHLGKVAHFRKHGSAIPAHVAYHNLEKITEVSNEFEPKIICFLGDLFHSKLNDEWHDFVKWVEYCKSEIILVSGNHDIIPTYLFEELGVKVVDELLLDIFYLTHHPIETKENFNFCGHIHPGIRMKGVGRQFLKLPCFYKTENQLVLPAFGNFTGKHILTPSEKDAIFAIADGEVIRISK